PPRSGRRARIRGIESARLRRVQKAGRRRERDRESRASVRGMGPPSRLQIPGPSFGLIGHHLWAGNGCFSLPPRAGSSECGEHVFCEALELFEIVWSSCEKDEMGDAGFRVALDGIEAFLLVADEDLLAGF